MQPRLLRGAGPWRQYLPKKAEDPFTYCKDLVRKHDYDSHLCSYFYPRRVHSAYFALKAFNAELAIIPETVSNSAIGQMRMQFWKDAVKSMSQDRPPLHPIAIALHRASKEFHLASYHINRIIESRIEELHSPTHLTIDSITAHAESVSSTLLYLLLSLLDLSSSTLYSHAASHLGVAVCFTTLLRALPYHASKGTMVIPAEITAKHGVRHEEVFRLGGNANGIDEAVFEFATLANDHLITAREMFKDGSVPKEAMPVFLAAIPAASYLNRLEVVNFDAFNGKLQLRDWKMTWDIWRGFRRCRF